MRWTALCGPARCSDPKPPSERIWDRGALGTLRAQGLRVQLQGTSVLVVEDDRDTRELFAAFLGKVGAEVRTASSVETAITLLATWRPDVVICDLHLPDVDGYRLLEHIHSSPAHHLPVIAISGSHPTVERERAMEAGFSEYLAKPCKLRDLVAMVTAVLTSTPLVGADDNGQTTALH